MTTSTIVTALTALSCDAYTVTATVRGDTIVASYHATDDDLGQAEHDGADASARIAEVLEAAGYTFSDAGGDDPGIYEVWHAPAPAVALANDPEQPTLVADMDDEEIALCLRNAAALDADILEREDGAHDDNRAYVAAYAAAHLARYGEVWTLP
jgi:hypothetical protein